MSDTTTIKVTEGAAFSGPDFRLDTAAGIARGVVVCGPVSLNGRDYPDAVRDRDKHVYDRSQVFVDHSDKERGVREWFGELRNPRTRVSDRRTIADLHYPKHSDFTAQFEERATKFPRSFGFSHVAVCESKRVNGRQVIEAIKRVESVDLVAKPATTAGLYESVLSEAVVVESVDGAGLAASASREAMGRALDTLVDKLKHRKLTPAEFLAEAKKVVEALDVSESVAIPTDGKAFAEFLAPRPALSESEYQKFLRGLRA